MKEFDESDINQDTIDVQFWGNKNYEDLQEQCKKPAPLPAHATYFSDEVTATLSYQNSGDKIKYFVVTYPYSENERNIYLKSKEMRTLHKIPKWKVPFKDYDTFLKDCINIMKEDFRTYHEENTFDTSKFTERDFVEMQQEAKQGFPSPPWYYGSLYMNGNEYFVTSTGVSHKNEVNLVPIHHEITAVPKESSKSLTIPDIDSMTYQDFLDSARRGLKQSAPPKEKPHHVTYHIYPQGNTTEKEIAETISKYFIERGWSTTLLGDSSSEHNTIHFSTAKDGSYLEFQRNPKPVAGSSNKALIFEGTISGEAISYMREITNENKKKFHTTAKNLEQVDIYSKEDYLNWYRENLNHLDMCILKIKSAKGGWNPKDFEEHILDALKENGIYRFKDQYTGTLRENQGMKNIIHQEIETMKRFGILKENVQTGTLSRDKDSELKFRQTFLTRKDNLSR